MRIVFLHTYYGTIFQKVHDCQSYMTMLNIVYVDFSLNKRITKVLRLSQSMFSGESEDAQLSLIDQVNPVFANKVRCKSNKFMQKLEMMPEGVGILTGRLEGGQEKERRRKRRRRRSPVAS